MGFQIAFCRILMMANENCIYIISIGISYDLVQIVQNPFSNLQKRLRNLSLICAISTGMFFVYYIGMSRFTMYVHLLQKFGADTNVKYILLHDEIINILINPWIALLAAVELIYSIYSIHKAFWGLCIRKGVNK